MSEFTLLRLQVQQLHSQSSILFIAQNLRRCAQSFFVGEIAVVRVDFVLELLKVEYKRVDLVSWYRFGFFERNAKRVKVRLNYLFRAQARELVIQTHPPFSTQKM